VKVLSKEVQTRFSTSISPSILEEFDRVVHDVGYGSRSKAVRDALLNFIAHQKMLGGKGARAGSITIVYDYRDPKNKLTSLKHRYAGIIEATLDLNLGEHHNLAIMAVNGDLSDISKFAKALQTQKNIKHIETVILASSKID
jgi:CopG family nickel-responsive transcriptional regulator